MKKYFLIGVIGILSFSFSVYALTSQFSFDSSMLTFSSDSKADLVSDSFNQDYSLTASISSKDEELQEKVKTLSKKTTYLLLGKMNSDSETSEEYYKRHKEYTKLAAYNYFPRDENSVSGYDETIDNYQYVLASELAIPQLFNQFNEIGVIYNSYGDIRVSINDNLAISIVTLPNVKIREQNDKNPMKYDLEQTNLVLYYYFLEIDGEYRLAYLFGETTDDLSQYFHEVEDNEVMNRIAIADSYESNLSSLYNFDQINQMSNEDFQRIYSSNINNIVYLVAYYNNKVVNAANGFFINDGIVVTTWSFLEDALIDAQYITIKGGNNQTYIVDGIITANPETDIAVIKLKEKTGNYVSLGDSMSLSTENPVVTISSKLGTGLVLQKGIVISNDDYIQTSIPLVDTDAGSPLFDKNGKVVGINTSKSTNTSVSISVNSKVLSEVQEKFATVDFDSIETISFEKLKSEYYYVKYNEEKIDNSISEAVWKKYSKIGDIEDNIKLKLLKANYQDGIVSLRYKNNISQYIPSMQLAAIFTEQLISDGYKEVLNSSSKAIYENEDYKIIIMDEFDYLIIVMVRL